MLWVVIFIISAVLYANLDQHFKSVEPQSWVRVADLSFEQSVRPFGVWSDEGRKVIDHLLNNSQKSSDGKILLVRCLATVETLISLTLLALFGFAIRRRFRMA